MKKGFINIKIKVLTLLLTFSVFYAYPAGHFMNQGSQKPGDRIEALRIAYITEQLNLTPQEAQKFWPLYNAYRNDLQTVQKNYPAGKSNLTAQQQLDYEQHKLDLKKRYASQFETALGTAKLNQLYNLEKNFQEKLKEVREQRIQQRNTIGSPRYTGRPK
jgi:hypothetical protein